MIDKSLASLDEYCRRSKYKGWDLFDGLNSKFFRKSFLFNQNLCRLAWIQLFKRSPLNLRKLGFVHKAYNAKGLSLFASGLIKLGRLDEAKNFLDKLRAMKCLGYNGISWGYNFPWQARAFYVPVGTPNMVTTVFVANAFLDYFDTTQKDEFLEIGEKSCNFILEHLVLFEDEKNICFAYIPGKEARVHNANMLGAALLGRLYKQTKNKTYLEKSMKAMFYSMQALTDTYLWPYGERNHHNFIDNFHTGFNLVSLKNWMDFTQNHIWEDKLQKAYKKYLNIFWIKNGCPKYYHNKIYPIDIHCSAQGIVTCLKLKKYDPGSESIAKKIACWAIENMQDNKGYFYYQKTKWYINKIPYIRWSQAWMFYALCLLQDIEKNND